MSWLGVNLNSSLNSIKGQITSFTRDVLAEEDEIQDDDIEIRLPKKRIKEYETSIYIYQQEIKELKENRAEAEERLRAADYNSLQKISLLQRQLNETLEELRQVKEKANEWTDVKLDVDKDGELQSSQHSQIKAVYEEKISLLQRQLEEERHHHEEEVLALQDAYRKDPRQVSGQEILSAASCRPQESHADLEEKQNEAEKNKDDRIRELEEEVNSLKSKLDASFQEKEKLDQDLVDLDNQNQLILDEVLKSKKQLAADLTNAKDEILKLKEATTVDKNIQNEVDATNESLSHENSELRRALEEARKQNDEETKTREEKSEELERVIREKTQQIDSLTAQLVQQAERTEKAEGEVTRLSDLTKRLEEQGRETVPRMEAELTAQKKREEALKYENETLQKRLSAKEREHDHQTQTIVELRDKIVAQEEEILKFEAVLEAKNVEHTNTFLRLKQHEEMTRVTLHELKEENQNLEDKVQQLEESSTKEDHKSHRSDADSCTHHYNDIINNLLSTCSTQNPKDLPLLVAELNSELASLRCERDRWSEDLASTMQDLREAQDLIETLESEKADLERENDNLRDELEENQFSERTPPEGATAPRSLPTIEEEEMDNSATQADDSLNEGQAANRESKGAGEREVTQLLERINHLNSQMAVFDETNKSLEAELATVKEEKGELEKKFENLSGAASDISCGNYTSQQDPSRTLKQSSAEEEKAKLERQIAQMTNAMDKMHFDSAHLSSREEEYQKERATMHDQIASQNKTIHDYFHENARLKALLNENNNASTLLKEYQGKLQSMEAELDKAKGLVIYKDDQIDQLTQEVEQIGEIFNLKGIDRQRMYLHVKQEHFQLMLKMNKLQGELEALKEENEELRENESDEETISKLRNELDTANLEMTEVKEELQKCKLLSENFLQDRQQELVDALSENEKLTAEKQELCDQLTEALSEKEALEQRINEMIQQLSHADTTSKAKEEEMAKFEERSAEKEKEFLAKIASLEQSLSSKIKEINQLNELTTKNSSEIEKWKSEELENIRKELNQTMSKATILEEENQSLKSKMEQLESEREQLILTSTQKHQEVVTYYQEIQRLSELLQKEQTQKSSETESLKEQLSLATEQQHKASQEAESLRQNLNSVQKDFIPKSRAMKWQEECERKSEELRKQGEDLAKQHEICKSIAKERDQLRLANSSFNAQYDEKRKELASIQDRERHLSQEVQRLKQHLVEIEETYTNEAVKSEEREAALRQSLARMHEKMASHSTHYSNTNQKTSAQLESLQKNLQEVVHQRDEARMQLQLSEEASLQHQEALTRLQQVLQDFQKNQSRDIAMATERERRKFENEKEKTAELERKLNEMKEKLEEAEMSSAASKALREELQMKEDSIIALKTQVHAIQLAAKRSQDQVSLLQSSADGKVDKHLLRNLIVGYFATPSDKQPEVLRVVAQVLDFSPEERTRTGLDQQPGSWLNSIANFLAPPPSNIVVTSKVDVLDHSSLSQAFIRFLEEESSPRTQPRLPAVQMAEEAHQKAQKKAQVKANTVFGTAVGSTHSPTPTPPPVTASSTSTAAASASAEAPNPLLLYSAASLPQDFPVISTPAVSTAAPITLLQVDTTAVSTPKFLNNLLNPKETKGQSVRTKNPKEEPSHNANDK